ncbi:MAG TPA: prephenate dehydratase [Planctomycetota bacterium]|nr:prephenate dehydratase [Planctomycetota bacterium]
MAKSKSKLGSGRKQPAVNSAAPAGAPNAASAADIEIFRRQIDECDRQIVELINKRAQAGCEIGKIKRREGAPVWVPARETAVYDRVLALNKGPLPDDCFRAIYREIMAGTITLQRPLRISYFGVPGSFTHQAALQKFGSGGVTYVAAPTFGDVFNAVERAHADFGIVPIENSTEGGINEVIDRFTATQLKIAGEVYLPVHQNLICAGLLDGIKTVASHPQPLAQCRNWIQSNLPRAELRKSSSTVEAIEWAAKDPTLAAIGSTLAARIHDVPILYRNIEDVPDNITRFLIIGQKSPGRSGKDKTSLMFAIKDAPGALYQMLGGFEKYKVNMTRIESRPSKRKAWEYIFFVDLQGHIEDPEVAEALVELEGRCKHIEVLGSYPSSEMLSVPSSVPQEVASERGG